jgi:hypothetical protein
MVPRQTRRRRAQPLRVGSIECDLLNRDALIGTSDCKSGPQRLTFQTPISMWFGRLDDGHHLTSGPNGKGERR